MKPLHQAKQIGDSFFSYFSQHCSILCACRTALLPILKITKQLKLSNLYTYDTVLFKLQLFSTANAFIVHMIGFVKPFWEAERRGECGRRWPLGAGQPRRGFLRPRGQEPASQWDPELPATAVSMPLLQVPAFHIIMWRKVSIFRTTGLLVFRIWSWWKFVADPGACPRLRHPCRCQRTDWSRWSEGLPGREVCRSRLLPHGLCLRRVHHPLLQEGWRLQEAQLRCAGHVHWLCVLPQGLREGIQVSCDAYDGNQKFKNCLQNRWHTRVYHLATEVAKGWVSDKWRQNIVNYISIHLQGVFYYCPYSSVGFHQKRVRIS